MILNEVLTQFIPLVSLCTSGKIKKSLLFSYVFKGYGQRVVVWNEFKILSKWNKLRLTFVDRWV